jgi:FkbM family methyltransferase
VDVGANVGYFSALAAAWGARVAAFEPSPGAFALLRLTAALQPPPPPGAATAAAAAGEGRFLLYPFAAGAHARDALLAADFERGWAFGGVAPGGGAAAPRPPPPPRRRGGRVAGAGGAVADAPVRVVRLDDYVAGPVTVLKIDTESTSAAVLEGAAKLLASARFVIVEVKDRDGPEARAGLRAALEAGRFSHAYSYREQYTWRAGGLAAFLGLRRAFEYPPVGAEFEDVTRVVRGDAGAAALPLPWEDFVLCRRPLDFGLPVAAAPPREAAAAAAAGSGAAAAAGAAATAPGREGGGVAEAAGAWAGGLGDAGAERGDDGAEAPGAVEDAGPGDDDGNGDGGN